MSNEYYVVVEEEQKRVSLCKYVFNKAHPTGDEVTIFSQSFASDSAFSLEDAKNMVGKFCDIFNRTRWDKIRPVYYR